MSTNTSDAHTQQPAARKPRHRRLILASAISAVLVTSAVGMTAVLASPEPQGPAAAPAQSVAAQVAPASFANEIASVKPAVVNVSTTEKVGAGAGGGPGQALPFPPDSPYGQFFKHFFGEQGGGNAPAAEVHALGSGFIIDPHGYVVTNNHVIDGAQKITVILNDGRKFPAKLVGRDPKTDLALLKIQSKETFPYVAFGDSDKARTGDWVLAIGNPFGLGGTATSGIISARGRDIHAGPYDDFLQIDAPINRGNSGGPLFNTRGKVIGINTAIYSPNGGSVGIGFAIPSDVARPVIAQLKSHGYVERGWLGVEIQPVTGDVAQSLGLEHARGALVASVKPDSPASRAGIEPGDVILAFNGKDVSNARDLGRLVADTPPQKKVDIGIWRDGSRRKLETVIALMPGPHQEASAGSSEQSEGQTPKLGLALAPVTPEMRQNYDVPGNVHGAMVVGVQDGSPAANSGIRSGDVIEMVGRHKVHEPGDVVRGVKQAVSRDHRSVLMLVDRAGEARFITVPLAKG